MSVQIVYTGKHQIFITHDNPDKESFLLLLLTIYLPPAPVIISYYVTSILASLATQTIMRGQRRPSKKWPSSGKTGCEDGNE